MLYAEIASRRGLDISMRHLQLQLGFDWSIACFGVMCKHNYCKIVFVHADKCCQMLLSYIAKQFTHSRNWTNMFHVRQ